MMNRNQYKNIKLKLNDIYNNQKVNLSYFVIDDFIYDLSASAIEDIKAHAKNNRVYFKDLLTSTLIEIVNS